MGRLTTHVLDLARGIPAAGIPVELWNMGVAPLFIGRALTNEDGRLDEPLIEESEIAIGLYELRFTVGPYLRLAGLSDERLLFLDEIPIRFGISDPDRDTHVPLLLSPYGYSTYRGS